MAGTAHRAVIPLVVWDPGTGGAERFETLGAQGAQSVAGAVSEADVVITHGHRHRRRALDNEPFAFQDRLEKLQHPRGAESAWKPKPR